MLGVAVAVAASVVAWLALRGTSHATPVIAPNSGPALVSQAQLEGLAGSLDHPIYWAGPKKGYSYELTRLTGDRTYVRYLPTGVRAGDPRASYLVVGTYAQPGSFANLKRASKQKGSVSLGIPGDGLAIFSPAKPDERLLRLPGQGLPGRGLLAVGPDRPQPRPRREDHAGRVGREAPGAQSGSSPPAFAARARMNSRSESRFRYAGASGSMLISAAAARTSRSARRQTVRAT